MNLTDMLDRVYVRSPYLGYANGFGLPAAYWRKRSPVPEGEVYDLDRDRCGVLCVAPVVPFDGEHVARAVEIIERQCKAYDFEPNIALLIVTPRHLDVVKMIMYDRDVAGEDKRAMECYEKMFSELVDAGYPPYRLGVQSAKLAPSSEGYDALVRRLKDALDPHNILSPGRYPLCDRTQAGRGGA